jgi:hypothetical protein
MPWLLCAQHETPEQRAWDLPLKRELAGLVIVATFVCCVVT